MHYSLVLVGSKRKPAALCGYSTATGTIKIEVSSRGHDLINVLCWRHKVDQYFDGATLECCFAEPHFTSYTKPLGSRHSGG